MATNKTDKRADADTIEREILRTQDEMGDTVDKLEEKLTPREVARSAMGDDGGRLAEEALEVTRTNPIPVALIAIGVIWLLATSNSPAIRRLTDRIAGRRGNQKGDVDLRPRSAEPAPIGPPPPTGDTFDRARRRQRAG